MMNAVTTYYLEMTSASMLNAKTESNGLEITECRIKQFEFNRFLYQMVGQQWEWTDKLAWSDDQWKEFAENDNLRTWVGYYQGTPAGYFELQKQAGEVIELAYFGLIPDFIGMGFGGYLLSQAIKKAWEWGKPEKVWVHTCTLDHPNALQNYQARGFEIFRTETRNHPVTSP